MINFEQIKTELLEKGMTTQELHDAATQKMIIVKGEWREDGSAKISRVAAGWKMGTTPKCLAVDIEFPALKNFDTAKAEAAIKAQYPDARVKFFID